MLRVLGFCCFFVWLFGYLAVFRLQVIVCICYLVLVDEFVVVVVLGFVYFLIVILRFVLLLVFVFVGFAVSWDFSGVGLGFSVCEICHFWGGNFGELRCLGLV